MNPKKRGLGRGLDALLQGGAAPHPPGAPAAAAAASPLTISIDHLEPNRNQPRTHFDDGDLQALASSIRTQGVVQPLVVTPAGKDRFTIVAGERRWRAAQLAGLTEVPVHVREVHDERELLELALVENLQRSDLDPVEEAEAYQQLQERFGLAQDAIAERVGKARTTVTNALRLLRLPAEVLDLLRSRALSAGQARPLLALGAAEDQVRLARRAIEQGLNARQIERLAAEKKDAPQGREAEPRADVHTVEAADRLTRRFQTKVEIRRRGKGGSVQFHFHSEEELIRLFDLLTTSGAKGDSDAP